MHTLDVHHPSGMAALRRGSAPPPLSSAQSMSLLQQHQRLQHLHVHSSNNVAAVGEDSGRAERGSSSRKNSEGSGLGGLLSHLVGKRKSSNSSQIQKHHQFGGGGGADGEEGRDQGLVLKVLNEEDSSLDGNGSVGHQSHHPPAPGLDTLVLSAAASENALDTAGRRGSANALALDGDAREEDNYDGIELAMVGGEVGGHGTQAMLNLDSVKDLLRCVSCRRFLFPPIQQCLLGHMTCKQCFSSGKQQCAKCQQKVLEVPAKLAEVITEQFRVRCSYADKGCQDTVAFKYRRQHEDVCPFKPVQCPEFDCTVTKPMNEIFKHFRLEHHHHFVNAHGSVFNGDIRCDDVNMIMGVERKWAPTMMKLDTAPPAAATSSANPPSSAPPSSSPGGNNGNAFSSFDDDDEPERQQQQQQLIPPGATGGFATQQHHFFLEILRTKHGVWHMWVWYLGEPDEASQFRCEVAIKKKNRDDDNELRYSGKVHSIRIPPHRVILSGCLLSFSDYTATHFRYLGEGHQGHPVIDYRVSVSHVRKPSSSSERAMTAGLTKMLRRFSIDSTAKANKTNVEH